MKKHLALQVLLGLALVAIIVLVHSPIHAEVLPQRVDSVAIQPNSPNVAIITSFSAKLTRTNTIRLKWETGAEFTLVGFNVYRKLKSSTEWEKINTALIPAKAIGSVTGANYSYVDLPVRSNNVYRYRLELAATNYSEWSDIITLKIKD